MCVDWYGERATCVRRTPHHTVFCHPGIFHFHFFEHAHILAYYNNIHITHIHANVIFIKWLNIVVQAKKTKIVGTIYFSLALLVAVDYKEFATYYQLLLKSVSTHQLNSIHTNLTFHGLSSYARWRLVSVCGDSESLPCFWRRKSTPHDTTDYVLSDELSCAN